VHFLEAASSATAPAFVDEADKYEGANVSATVTSQIRQRPLYQGIRVSPSGRLSSDLAIPGGFLTDGTSARLGPCQINSLSC